MFFKKISLLTSAGLLLSSPIALADISKNINNLPNAGKISISGIVDSVESKKDFTLRDEAGNKISVQSPTEITFNQGDSVEVHGHLGSDVTGEETGITAFKVKVNDAKEPSNEEKTSLNVENQ